jgi:hypothetical protein
MRSNGAESMQRCICVRRSCMRVPLRVPSEERFEGPLNFRAQEPFYATRSVADMRGQGPAQRLLLRARR